LVLTHQLQNTLNMIEISWLMSIVTGYQTEIVVECLNHDMMSGILKWMNTNEVKLLIPLIRIIGNVMKGTNEMF
jgi:hypothetical protein